MNWKRGSLHPPPDADGDDADADAVAADPPMSCLLDRKLFVGDRTNATTAWYDHPGDDEIAIQVTLFVAPPPRVSYVLAWCVGAHFTQQPTVVGTQDGLVLLSIAFSHRKGRPAEYYMHQPGGDHGGAGDPSLHLFTGGWRADTWVTTAMATSPWRQLEDWHNESTVDDRGLSVAGSVDLAGLLDLYDHDFGSLFVDKPVLSLHEHDIVCFFTAKRDIMERQEFVIVVDMMKKEVRGVNPLAPRRVTKLIYSTVSSHLLNNVASTTATGGKGGGLKRPGAWLELYPHKKQFMVASSVNGEQEQGVVGTHDADDMDLDED